MELWLIKAERKEEAAGGWFYSAIVKAVPSLFLSSFSCPIISPPLPPLSLFLSVPCEAKPGPKWEQR